MSSDAQTKSYWAETSTIDRFILIENGIERTVPTVKSNQSFHFSCDPKVSKIRLECSRCKETVSIKLISEDEDAATRTIKLEKNHNPIAIKELFQNPSKPILSSIFDTFRKAFQEYFLPTANEERVAIKRAPALMGAEDPKENDPKLSFSLTDFAHFLTTKDFELRFTVHENFPINSIYIIKKKKPGEKLRLLLYGGKYQLIENLFSDFAGKGIPITKIVEQIDKQDNNLIYQIRWQTFLEYLAENIDQEGSYQLGINLGADISDHNPYLFNFSFYSDTELDEVEKFLDGQ